MFLFPSQHLSDMLTKYFTEDAQMKLYRDTVMQIMKQSCGKIPLDVSDSVIATFELSTSGWVGCSPGKETYLEYYATEIKLNETFNIFVSNYRRGYQGLNTARVQIGAKFNTRTRDILFLPPRYSVTYTCVFSIPQRTVTFLTRTWRSLGTSIFL